MKQPILYFHPAIKDVVFEKFRGPYSIYIVSTEKVKFKSIAEFGQTLEYISATFSNNQAFRDQGYIKATKANLKLHKRKI